MSYTPLKKGVILSPSEFVAEMNKAIKDCDGYLDGMVIVNTGSGCELTINETEVHHSTAEHILMRAERLVKGLVAN